MLDITSNPDPMKHQDRRKNRNRNKGRRCAETDRRNLGERRHDFRNDSNKPRRTLSMWWRSVTNARLGVDRRKQERRRDMDRRQKDIKNVLTEEEISELLNW